MGCVELGLGAFGSHPLNAIDLRIFPPIHGERARIECLEIELRFDGPGNDDFAGSKLRLSKGDPAGGRCGPPGLLLEFTSCSLDVYLAVFDEAFDHRPRPGVFVGKPWSTWVRYQHLETTVETVGEKTRRSHRTRHYAGFVTSLATYTQGDQDLASFNVNLQLGEAEPLGDGVKRVAMEQLELAAAGFFDGEAVFGEAIHESRKAIKRVRALLRLIRGELSKKIYTFENTSLRDTAHLVSEIRSAQGVLNAATSIKTIYGDLLADGTFDDMLERLTRRRDLTELQALEDPNLVGRVVRNLERAYKRYSSWPTEPEARAVYGHGVRDAYESVGPGLTRTYMTGRHHMARAYKQNGPEDFHEWRKRVKDMRHQMEFLAPLWPEVVVGTAMTLDRLGSVLGEDNDLAELTGLLRGRNDLCPDPRERSLFRALSQQRRADLQMAAEILGRRVYAERPKAVTERFGEYWDARKLAIDGTLDTIVVY